MSDAKKCDRCGEFYETRKNGFIIIDLSKGVTGKSLDLCPMCVTTFWNWLNEYRNQEAADEAQ